ncbi:MAG: hypothetical protein AB8G15_18215 [Saprospiraceae bacterium]
MFNYFKNLATIKKKESKNLEALKNAKQIEALDKSQQVELKGGLGYGQWW